MLKMSALLMNACSKSFTPLVNNHVNNVQSKIAPDLNQSLFQFISALDVCMVNMFLNGRLYLTVSWVEVWPVWRSKIQHSVQFSVVDMLVGVKSTNRMQQLHDFNTVCYEKVIQQVRNGHQVGCVPHHVYFTLCIENLALNVRSLYLYTCIMLGMFVNEE